MTPAVSKAPDFISLPSPVRKLRPDVACHVTGAGAQTTGDVRQSGVRLPVSVCEATDAFGSFCPIDSSSRAGFSAEAEVRPAAPGRGVERVAREDAAGTELDARGLPSCQRPSALAEAPGRCTHARPHVAPRAVGVLLELQS